MAIIERYANFVTPAGGLNEGTSEANAWETPADVVTGAVAGDRVNMRFASRYTLSVSTTFTFAGSVTQPIIIRGYETTIGDGGKILLHYPISTTYQWSFTGDGVYIHDIDITHDGTGSGISFSFQSDAGYLKSLKFVSTTTGTMSDSQVRLDDCNFGSVYVESAGNDASSATLFLNRANGSSVVGNSTNGRNGVRVEEGYRQNCVGEMLIYSRSASTSKGLEITGGVNASGMYLGHLTIHGFDTSISIATLPDPAGTGVGINNVVLSDAVNGIIIVDAVNKMGISFGTIAFYNCTNDTVDIGDNIVIDKISLTADPFIDSTNYDFRPNNVAGGGALLKRTALIGAGEINSNRDIGALQHADPASATLGIGV